MLIVVHVPSGDNGLAAGYAVANAYPAFSVKTRLPSPTHVDVVVLARDGTAINYPLVGHSADSTRMVAALVDM